LTITFKAPDGAIISGDTPEEAAKAYAAIMAVAAAAPAAAPAAPAGTVRVNPATNKAAPNTVECGLCMQICSKPEACYCIDFDVPGHIRKFTTTKKKGFGTHKGKVFDSGLEQHAKKNCYASPMTDEQHVGIPQRLIWAGYTVIDPAGIQVAQLGGSKGSPKRTVDTRAVGAVTEVPGGPNRTTPDGFPMCRATYRSGTKAGQLCTTKVDPQGIRISGTCFRHQEVSFWEALGTYAADPTTPPYSQEDLPEVGSQPAGTGNEAQGAQTADTANDTTTKNDQLASMEKTLLALTAQMAQITG